MRICAMCGTGAVVPTAREGRIWQYRGMQLLLPADVLVPTCDNAECAAEWFDQRATDAVDDALERAWNAERGD